MATLQATIALRDKFTSTLQRMAGSTHKLTSSMDNLQTAINRTDTAIAGVSGNMGRINSGFDGIGRGALSAGNVIDNFAAKTTAAVGRVVAAAATMQTVMSAGRISDEYSQTKARLDLMNDGLQSTAQLQNMIFQSAMNARGDYQATADAAAKMGVLAGEAFSGNRELVAFMEQINKQFAISGTSAVGIQAAMLQLTQAMGAGALRGEELNSVLEQAPTIVKTVAKYMKVSTGELRELASEGKVTASIVKAAMLAAADETNATFEKMPVTFSQAWTMTGNVAYKAFTPVWEALGRVANNKNLDTMLNNLYPVLMVIGAGTAGVIDSTVNLAGIVTNVLGYAFSWTSAIAVIGLNGITAAIPFVLAAVLGLAAGWAVWNGQTLLSTAYILTFGAAMRTIFAVMIAYNAVIWTVTAAKRAWTAGTIGAATANGILAASVWLVTLPLLKIAAIIVGVVVVALAIWGMSTLNLRDSFANAMDFMIDACEGGVNTMARMINKLVGIINKAANGLNGLFGTNIGTLDYVGTVDFQGAKKWSGYVREGTFMQHATEAIKGMFGVEMPNGDYGQGSFDPSNAETAKNTKGIKDALGILDEDIKYMRDIADREYISQTKYSTVKIDMSGMTTTVHNKGDLDGYIDGLGQYMSERMANAVEGVHAE